MTTKNLLLRAVFANFLSLFLSCLCFSQEAADSTTKNIVTNKSFQTIKELWATPFKPQGVTGTCWCFSTTSFLESEAHRLGRGDFEISTMHTVYYAYLEKAQRYLRSHTENPFRKGGLSHDVIYVLEKYGTVPRSAYIGSTNADNNYDHREMYNALSGMLTGVAAAGKDVPLGCQLTKSGVQWFWMNGFRGLLDSYMGKPPDSINYKGKIFTPKEFSTVVLNLPLQNYVEITSYSQFPFYSANEFLLPDNWLHNNKFYNVPLNDFMKIIDHALENGFSLCIDLHLTDDEAKCKNNYLLGFDEEKNIKIDQNERDKMLDNWRIEDIHLEHMIGIAKDEQGNKFYKLKDSNTPVDKHYNPVYNKEYFSVNYVKSRVLFILVHKDGLPTDILNKLGIK
jgi:bleomycin hydrolase